MAYKPAFRLDREYILQRVTEEEIFQKYLGIYPSFKRKYTNPLRSDGGPGCEFVVSGGKLQFRDWSRRWNEDCFGIVMYSYRCNFAKALEIVATDFGLVDSTGNPTNLIDRSIKVENKAVVTVDGLSLSKVKQEVFIETYSRSEWTKKDVKYWKSYYLKSEILDKFKVDTIEGFYLHNPNKINEQGKPFELYSQFSKEQLAFDYDCNGYHKIYQPKNQFYKWTSNVPHKYYDGYLQLPETGPFCLVTKSRKDVMCLSKWGIPSVAPQAESSVISNNGYALLIARFPKLFSLYDFDRSGCRGAFIMRDKYDITPLFLTNGRYKTINYEAKDFSDFLKYNGEEKTEYLIKSTLDKLKL